MADLELSGHTPVLYFDPEDAEMDGSGFNVLFANGATVDRCTTLDEAVAVFRELLDEVADDGTS